MNYDVLSNNKGIFKKFSVAIVFSTLSLCGKCTIDTLNEQLRVARQLRVQLQDVALKQPVFLRSFASDMCWEVLSWGAVTGWFLFSGVLSAVYERWTLFASIACCSWICGLPLLKLWREWKYKHDLVNELLASLDRFIEKLELLVTWRSYSCVGINSESVSAPRSLVGNPVFFWTVTCVREGSKTNDA